MRRGKGAGMFPAALLGTYLCFYAVQAIYSTYFNLYLNDVGFSKMQMGTIASLATLLVLLVQPLWGMRSDRDKQRNTVPKYLLALGCITVLGFYVSAKYVYVLIVNCMVYACLMPISPLLDTISLETLDAMQGKQFHFGQIRIWGTIGYCLSVLLFGRVFREEYSRMFAAISILFGVGFLCFWFVPTVGQSQAAAKKKPFSFKLLFADKRIVCLLVIQILFQLTSYNYHAFYPIYFQTNVGDSTLIGVMMFASALSEIPMWLLCDRIIRKFGIQRTVCAACGLTALRWLVLYVTTNPVAAILINLTHGVGFVVLSYCMITLINESAPIGFHATAQSLANILLTIFTRIIGGVVCGWLCDVWGVKQIMLFNLLVMVTGLLYFIPSFRRASHRLKSAGDDLTTRV